MYVYYHVSFCLPLQSVVHDEEGHLQKSIKQTVQFVTYKHHKVMTTKR